MKKLALRWIGAAAAVSIAVGSVPSGAVVAKSAAADDFEMSLLTCEDRQDVCLVSPLDTAEQDVTIQVGVYIQSEQWDADDYIEGAGANWRASDPQYISFTNISNIASTTGEQRTISYSGGTYLSAYNPYCFVKLVKRSSKYGAREMNRDISVTTTEYAYDPIFGSTITQLGENRIGFTCTYYASKEDKEADVAEGTSSRKQTKSYECEVQYDESGQAYYTYQYIRQDTYAEDTAVGYLPRYKADMEVGTEIPGMSDYILWLYKGTTATSFFGESSDEFAFVTFDIVLEKGTPAGRYSVDLVTENEKTYLSGSTSKTHYPVSANGLTILVDESAPRITEPPVTTTTVEITAETATETVTETTTEEATTTTTLPETTTTLPVTETTRATTTPTPTETVPPETTSTTTTTTTGSTSSTTTSQETETTTTAPILAQPYLTPKKTVYVEEPDTLLLYNAGVSTVTWLSGSDQILEIEESDSTHAVLRGKNPGTVQVYALVNGTVLSCQVTVEERYILYGDVNRDGQIHLDDAILVEKYLMGNATLEYHALKTSDCDANGTVNNSDLLVLLNFLVKKIDSLPNQV